MSKKFRQSLSIALVIMLIVGINAMHDRLSAQTKPGDNQGESAPQAKTTNSDKGTAENPNGLEPAVKATKPGTETKPPANGNTGADSPATAADAPKAVDGKTMTDAERQEHAKVKKEFESIVVGGDEPPNPTADFIFSLFNYVSGAAVVSSIVFGALWFIRYKKRLASGEFDEEEDEEGDEEESTAAKTEPAAPVSDSAKSDVAVASAAASTTVETKSETPSNGNGSSSIEEKSRAEDEQETSSGQSSSADASEVKANDATAHESTVESPESEIEADKQTEAEAEDTSSDGETTNGESIQEASESVVKDKTEKSSPAKAKKKRAKKSKVGN